MKLLRRLLATVFVCWPVLVVIKLMHFVRTPACWLFGLFSEGAAEWLKELYAKIGLRLYWVMIASQEGKDAANMAVLELIIEYYLEHQRGSGK